MTKRQHYRLKQLATTFNQVVKASPKHHQEAAQVFLDAIMDWLPDYHDDVYAKMIGLSMAITRVKRESTLHKNHHCACYSNL
jgi:hypothetical protein